MEQLDSKIESEKSTHEEMDACGEEQNIRKEVREKCTHKVTNYPPLSLSMRSTRWFSSRCFTPSTLSFLRLSSQLLSSIMFPGGGRLVLDILGFGDHPAFGSHLCNCWLIFQLGSGTDSMMMLVRR